MTPERQKHLESLGWSYRPDCICALCAEYRDGLVQLDAGIPVESDVTDARTLRRLSADMAPAAKVGTNAKVEGEKWEGADIPGVYMDEFRADELGSKKPRLTDSERRKATPIFSGVMRYFPDALAAVARLSKAGNDKHNPGEPLHWSRGKSTDHGDCIARHQITFDQIDEETGEFHAVAVAWRALAQLQLLEEAKKAERDAKACAQESQVANPWQRWLPSWTVKPKGRVDVCFRNGEVQKNQDARFWNWDQCGDRAIAKWRRAA
jgi:hypothetical protein